MMVSTHLLSGILYALILSSYLSEGLVILSASVIIGSFFPDFDALFHHRKTLHRPLQYLGFSALFLIIFQLTGSFILLNIFLFFSGALMHCFLDLISSKTGGDALYNHIQHKWIGGHNIFPTRSEKDTAVAIVFSLPLFATFNPAIILPVIFLLTHSFFYPRYKEEIENKILKDHSTYSELIDGYKP